MIRFYHLAPLGVALSLFGCSSPAPPAPSRPPVAEVPRDRLRHIVDRYWDESVLDSPWHAWGGGQSRYAEPPAELIASQDLADALAIERRALDQLNDVPRGTLDPDSQLTYDIFRRERELTIEGFKYPAELMPVNPYDSTPQRFALMAAAAVHSALRGGKDADQWRTAAESYQRWTNQATANMREGMRRGYTLPKVLVERMLPILAALGEDSASNFFYLAVHADSNFAPAPAETGTTETASAASSNAGTTNLAIAVAPAGPSATVDPERERVAAALKDLAHDEILPAYRTLHDFLEREYLPRARQSAGLSALPLGATWYLYRVKRVVSDETPAQLHTLGVAEVERLRGRLLGLLKDTAFAGNPQGFLDNLRRDPRFSYQTATALLAAYQALKAQAASAVAGTFADAPKAEFEIRSVEAFRMADTPALSYQPAVIDQQNSAVLYINTAGLDTRPMVGMVPQFLAQAIPGQHYQLSTAQERADLPMFRRWGGAPAFIDGWALYVMSIGDEIGMYHDLEARVGSLLAQLSCAAGVVIDTGIHAQQWTRQQAIDYLHSRLPVDDESAANVIDRDIAFPGEALGCELGSLKLLALRARSEETLGARFDVRAFHSQLLNNGALPLDLLDSPLKTWLESAAKVAKP